MTPKPNLYFSDEEMEAQRGKTDLLIRKQGSSSFKAALYGAKDEHLVISKSVFEF